MSTQIQATMAPTSSTPMSAHPSPWHSPVPYLFGGLAAMLGLIAFALLILACSYWKLSGYLDNRSDADTDLESGNAHEKPDNDNDTAPAVFEEKYLVIMAGQEKPTFLATPISSRASSFGSSSYRTNSTVSTENLSTTSEVEEDGEERSNDQLQLRITEYREDADRHP